jgi:putative DNA primase/helicase
LIIALVRIVESEPRYSNVFWSVSGQDVRAAAQLIDYFKSHACRVYARLHGENPDNLLLLALEGFLKEQGEYWEGMSSELFEIMKDRSAPGLPGGEVPFGKLLRKIANDPDNDLVLNEGWRGNQPIIKVTLPTAGPTHADTTESTREEVMT